MTTTANPSIPGSGSESSNTMQRKQSGTADAAGARAGDTAGLLLADGAWVEAGAWEQILAAQPPGVCGPSVAALWLLQQEAVAPRR